MYAILEELIGLRTVAEWLALCLPLGIPASRVRDVQEVAEDDYLRSVSVIEAVEHPSEGPIIRIRLPAMFSASGRAALRHAPRLGEDTWDVLAEAGLSVDEIDELTAGLAPSAVPASGPAPIGSGEVR